MILKILVVIERNSWADYHIAHSLELMGHAVTRFFFGEYVGEFYGLARRAERAKRNSDLVNLVRKLKDNEGLDLIFCYVFDDFLLPKYARALANLNIPMVNYNVDMPTQWFRQIRTARYFDMMLCAQPDNMENLSRYANKVLYFPMAAPSCSLIKTEKKYDVSFLGTATPYRMSLFSKLACKSINLNIFGKYWDCNQPEVCYRGIEKTLSDIMHYGWTRLRSEKFGAILNAFIARFSRPSANHEVSIIPKEIIKGRLTDAELSILFSASKINIGQTRYAIDDFFQAGRCHMKLRDFEVPMAGGFYLVEKSPGYDQAFVDGKEVVTWQTLPELIEKIHYYLQHEDEREAIALAGQKRAMRDHTWEKRFDLLFSELGLIK